MRRPPPLSELLRFPITGGIALLALGVTIATYGFQVGLDPIVVDHRVQQGQVWRLLASILPHVGVIHLFFNLSWLWTLGTLAEEELGPARLLALVVFLSLGSMAAEYALMASRPPTGLSGVVYGIWGMFFVLASTDVRFCDAADAGTNMTFVVWFFLCIGLTWADVLPVANVAHGAGAVLGALVGLAMTRRPRMLWWATAAVVCAGSVFAAMRLRPCVNFSRNDRDEFAIAFAAVQAGRLDEGDAWYRRALRVDPKNHRAWFNLGLLCLTTGREAEGAQYLRRAAELNPGEEKYKMLDERSRLTAPPGAAAEK